MKKKRFLPTRPALITGFIVSFEQLTAINFFAYQLFPSIGEFEKKSGNALGSLQKFLDGKAAITEDVFVRIRFAVLEEMQNMSKTERWESNRVQTCYSYLLQLFPELKITDTPKPTSEPVSVRNLRKKLTVSLYTWDRWTDPQTWFEAYSENWSIRWILCTDGAPKLVRLMEGIKKNDISKEEYLAPIEEQPDVIFFNFAELENYPDIYKVEKLALAHAVQKAPDSRVIIALSQKSSPHTLFEMRMELLTLGHRHLYFVYLEDRTAQFNFGTLLIG